MVHLISSTQIPVRAPVRPPEPMEIRLTDLEARVCSLLDECKSHLQTKGIDTECRVAGGWVRDKLLGMQSNDIDIALSNIMGLPFAEHFVEFVSSQDLDVKGVTKVASNPEQSKHLETAKTTVLGIELDFVNLRSEEYAEDSRIPTEIKFGTPKQDALRRDITINALFYNVHTHSVEDYTSKGVDDLRKGVIRTPLPPKETFRDDPLRVLRCIRFASRFGFEMDPELQDAARDVEIQQALGTKISRERVGEEIDKMMKGQDPLRAIQLITELSLQSSIFSLPSTILSTFSEQPASYKTSQAAATILHSLLSSPCFLNLPTLHPLLTSNIASDPTTTRRLFLATALTPYAGITYVDHKRKPHLAVEAAIREGLKLGTQNNYLDGIPALFSAAAVLKNPVLERLEAPSPRVAIGLLLRDKSVHNPITGSHWATSLLFSLVQELVPLWNESTDHFDVDEAIERVNLYNKLSRRIEELGLPASVDAKPILDGREVVSALDVGAPGAWLGRVMSQVAEWQLEHPEGSKDECVAWLKAEQAAGRVSMEVGPKRVLGERENTGVRGKKAKR